MFLRKLNNNNEGNTDFTEMFRSKKIPILTLDERWLALFPEQEMSAGMKQLRDKLNNLLKKQGKTVDDIKNLKRVKKDLMQEIVDNMEVDDSLLGKIKGKKLEKNQKLILDIKDELIEREDKLADLPYEIRNVNAELMSASALICYGKLENNNRQVKQLEESIANMRIQLKEMILKKQDLETETNAIYSYMHDVLGANTMEILDDEILNE